MLCEEFGVSLLQQGNRSSSSACGSADVLEALGIAIELGPQVNANTLFISPPLLTTRISQKKKLFAVINAFE